MYMMGVDLLEGGRAPPDTVGAVTRHVTRTGMAHDRHRPGHRARRRARGTRGRWVGTRPRATATDTRHASGDTGAHTNRECCGALTDGCVQPVQNCKVWVGGTRERRCVTATSARRGSGSNASLQSSHQHGCLHCESLAVSALLRTCHTDPLSL